MEQTYVDSLGILHKRPVGSPTSRTATARPANTTAYTAADCVLGLLELPRSVIPGVPMSVLGRLDISMSAVPSGMTSFSMHAFGAIPTDLSELADNDAWSGVPLSAIEDYLGSTSSAFTPADVGGFLSGNFTLNLYAPAPTASLWVALVTTAGWTPESATAFTFRTVCRPVATP
jgi:hypothetical protein